MVVYLVTAALNLILGMFVFAQQRSQTTAIFAAMCVALAVWSLELFFLASIKNTSELLSLFHITRPALFLIGPLCLYFIVAVTRTHVGPRLKKLLLFTFMVGVALSVLNNTILPSELKGVPKGFSPKLDAIGIIFYGNFLLSSLAALFIATKAFSTSAFKERHRTKWILIGTSIGFACGIIHIGFPKLYVGIAGSSLFLYFVSYAAVKHQFIGTQVTVSSRLIKILAALPLIGIFIGLDAVSEAYGLKDTGFITAQILVALVCMELHFYLSKFLTHMRNLFLIEDTYNYEFVHQMNSSALNSVSSSSALHKLGDQLFLLTIKVEDYSLHLSPHFFENNDHSSDTALDGSWKAYRWDNSNAVKASKTDVTDNMNVERSDLNNTKFLSFLEAQTETVFYDEVVNNYKGEFQSRGISAAVPIRQNNKVVGFIMLGRPLKKEQFSHDDIRLMNWFGQEVGSVLEKLITHINLEASLNEAEKTLSIVSEFNGYNHDLKTPFSNIEALISAGDVFTKEERETRILEQVARGNALLSTMVNILKGQHYKTKYHFDFNQMINDVIASFPTQSNTVTTSFEQLPRFFAYEDELKILFLNLLSNAFHAKDKDSFEVHISTVYDSDTGRVICKVGDNGCGIDSERLKSLWSKQLSTRRNLGGSGIGLSVIKRIVEEHEGLIDVTSIKGQGTEFTLSFPAHSSVSVDTLENTVAQRGISSAR